MRWNWPWWYVSWCLVWWSTGGSFFCWPQMEKAGFDGCLYFKKIYVRTKKTTYITLVWRVSKIDCDWRCCVAMFSHDSCGIWGPWGMGRIVDSNCNCQDSYHWIFLRYIGNCNLFWLHLEIWHFLHVGKIEIAGSKHYFWICATGWVLTW